MSAAERCTAQPVHRVGGIAVDGPGEYSSGEVTARSGGVVHWVERVVSDGETVHVGVCGLANETTRIGQPGVVTRALPEAMIGDELHDVATVSGTLAAGAEYAVRFEAYRASVPANRAREEGCTAADRIFASDPVPVRGPGDVRSPGFTAEWAHGETVWWVETLLIDQGDGFEALHRGECGLPEETTRIGRPEVSTLAQERVVAGDPMVDTARVTGEIAANDGASWELVFTGYLAPEEDDAFDAGDAAGEETEGAADAEGAESPAADAESAPDAAPVCDDANRIFTTDPVPVEGPGEIDSPPVVADADWAGRVWWVETLWLVQGEERTAVHEGACGIPDETTLVTTPRITTEATEFAAVGDEIRDTARLTGELSAREGTAYDVVFAGYRGDPALTGTEEAECADDERLFETAPVPVDGPGDIVSPPVTALPEYGGTIWWVETLRITDADGTRDVVRGTCGLPGETTTVQFPTVRTESAGTIEVGEQMYDTAVVEGPITERPDAEVRVVFTAHARGADGALVCDAGTELPRLSDPEGAEVTGPGRYESRRVTTVPRDAGLGGYVETLLLIVDGERHVIHRGACGAAGEDFEIRAAAPPAAPGTPLATTGAADPGPLLPIAAALLLAGAAIAAVAGVRRARSRGTVRDCGDMREEAGARR